MRQVKGTADGRGMRIGIVVARFNEKVTSRLLEGAREALAAHGVKDEDITVAWVPGSVELPVVAQAMASSGRYQAIICLGAVVRHETAHYQYVAQMASQGIARVALDTGIPVAFGVLTTDSLEQALERAGGKEGNRGYDAALAALETARCLQQLR